MCVLSVGERLERGIKNSLLLQSDEAVVLTAQEEHEDTLSDGNSYCSFLLTHFNLNSTMIVVKGKKILRTPGDKWMITGPAEYIPRIEIGAIEHRWAYMYMCTIDIINVRS